MPKKMDGVTGYLEDSPSDIVGKTFTFHFCESCGIVSVKDGACRVCGVTDRHKTLVVKVP